MAGERSLRGVLAGAGGRRVPGLLGLLLAMEAGVLIPVPSDLVMLLLGERVSAGALPLWLAMVALELVALVGTASLFLAARGPAWALLTRLGPGRAVTNPPRSDPSRSNHPGPTRPGPTHPVPTRASAWAAVPTRATARAPVPGPPAGRVAQRRVGGAASSTGSLAGSGGTRGPQGRALPALLLGSSLFLQAHLLLGYALGLLGPTARPAPATATPGA